MQLATARSHGAVTASHLTLALLDCDGEDRVWQLLNLCGIKRDEMRLYVEAVLDATPSKNPTGKPPRTVAFVKKMLRDASQQSKDYNEAENQNALLLISLVAERSANGKTLRALGLRPEELRRQLRHLTEFRMTGEQRDSTQSLSRTKKYIIAPPPALTPLQSGASCTRILPVC